MENIKANEVIEGKVLFEKDDYKFIWLGWDKYSEREIIQTNQYLIMTKDMGILLDPGGVSTFSKVVAVVSQYIPMTKIKVIFYTHQDPDVSSGIAMWLGITNANIYISNKWIRFLPHFGIFDASRIVPLKDQGGDIKIDGYQPLIIVPAHFMHSPGNLIIYDPNSKILFSGDIGAAVFPPNKKYLFVEKFEDHLQAIEAFHQRYMASNKVLRYFVDKISKYEIKMICPQHGAIYDGENVKKFLDWLYNLKCGIDIIETIY
ncbi:MAG: FprA family A-type flavoprotein [Spirochaetes bacterium]|nr:FprA family A-type flavoprotein [Spirochaetota bacterium]